MSSYPRGCSQPRYHKFSWGCLLCFCLIGMPSKLAAYEAVGPNSPKGPTGTTGTRYTPPANPSAPGGSTTSAGVRGACGSGLNIGLTALAPKSHIGQTVSSHPTFAWFVQDTKPYPLAFQLYETGTSDRRLVYETELQSQPGIMHFTLPQQQPGLQVGKRYLWQVVMVCNPNRPADSSVAETELMVVELPAALKSQLATRDRASRVNRYAAAGFWYDAMAEALQIAESQQNKTLTIALLQDLASLEAIQAPSGSGRAIRGIAPKPLSLSERLQQIAAIEGRSTPTNSRGTP